MLILRGIAGTFDGKDYPRGALDEPSAIEYAKRRGYEPVVLDVSGEAYSDSPQVIKALEYLDDHDDVEALYGFSGGGYNVRHILANMSNRDRGHLKLVVVLGAPHNSKYDYKGDWETVYRLDPKEGHMAGPRMLLAELPPTKVV
jgi:hypothetical protein